MKVTTTTVWELADWGRLAPRRRHWRAPRNIITLAANVYEATGSLAEPWAWEAFEPSPVLIVHGRASTEEGAREQADAALRAWVLEQGGET